MQPVHLGSQPSFKSENVTCCDEPKRLTPVLKWVEQAAQPSLISEMGKLPYYFCIAKSDISSDYSSIQAEMPFSRGQGFSGMCWLLQQRQIPRPKPCDLSCHIHPSIERPRFGLPGVGLGISNAL